MNRVDNKIKSSLDELRNILTDALNVLNDFDTVKNKIHELMKQNESVITLSQVHSVISKLSYADSLVFYGTQGVDIESARFLKLKVGEIFIPATITCNSKSVSSVYNRLKETVENAVKALDVFETDIKNSFDYEFSSDEQNNIKHAITTYLDGEYFKNIAVDIPSKISGSAEISFTKEPFISYDANFEGVFDDLISENQLEVSSIRDWLYENDKDFEWYEEEINYGEVKQEIIGYLQSTLEHLKPIEIEHFVDNMEIIGSIDMTPVAERIVNDIDDYCKRCDDLLTIENLRASERLRDIIWDKSDWILCDKEFASPDLFEHVSYGWIADGIAYRHETTIGKKIIEMIKSNPEYATFGEDELSDMIYSYIEDNPIKELGKIIREDKELVYEIIPEDSLFNAGGVWVFYPY